ncbi:hypothetical protein GDO86_020289 [Hymenochirus boettgeri]|uniref:Uncharacterized protein n=1 Tax=Hymenochirus boettgeri TaxID=247094 RepID=A0A8T2IIM4_9PIPI|nr:hypothetical protein GDO86_020289 [Hymenochirus boettgeri]
MLQTPPLVLSPPRLGNTVPRTPQRVERRRAPEGVSIGQERLGGACGVPMNLLVCSSCYHVLLTVLNKIFYYVLTAVRSPASFLPFGVYLVKQNYPFI